MIQNTKNDSVYGRDTKSINYRDLNMSELHRKCMSFFPLMIVIFTRNDLPPCMYNM